MRCNSASVASSAASKGPKAAVPLVVPSGNDAALPAPVKAGGQPTCHLTSATITRQAKRMYFNTSLFEVQGNTVGSHMPAFPTWLVLMALLETHGAVTHDERSRGVKGPHFPQGCV